MLLYIATVTQSNSTKSIVGRILTGNGDVIWCNITLTPRQIPPSSYGGEPQIITCTFHVINQSSAELFRMHNLYSTAMVAREPEYLCSSTGSDSSMEISIVQMIGPSGAFPAKSFSCDYPPSAWNDGIRCFRSKSDPCVPNALLENVKTFYPGTNSPSTPVGLDSPASVHCGSDHNSPFNMQSTSPTLVGNYSGPDGFGSRSSCYQNISPVYSPSCLEANAGNVTASTQASSSLYSQQHLNQPVFSPGSSPGYTESCSPQMSPQYYGSFICIENTPNNPPGSTYGSNRPVFQGNVNFPRTIGGSFDQLQGQGLFTPITQPAHCSMFTSVPQPTQQQGISLNRKTSCISPNCVPSTSQDLFSTHAAVNSGLFAQVANMSSMDSDSCAAAVLLSAHSNISNQSSPYVTSAQNLLTLSQSCNLSEHLITAGSSVMTNAQASQPSNKSIFGGNPSYSSSFDGNQTMSRPLPGAWV